ncbi:unnamed protein product [Calypogeia fissa]
MKVSIALFKSWEKCIPANTQPEALLYSENGGPRIRLEMTSSPFRLPLSPMSSKGRCRCGSFLCLIFGTLLFVVLFLVLKHLLQAWPNGGAGYRHYEQNFKEGVCNESLSVYLKDLTRNPHVAGTTENFDTADYIYSKFMSYGINTRFTDYEVLLSYPEHRALYLTGTEGFDGGFALEEDDIDEDPYTRNDKIVSTFHGYSPSGNVSGEVVYANYGSVADFEQLDRWEVNITGSIVIARYGEIYRGDIVAHAAYRGAVGVVIFSDPLDWAANNTEGYYPESEWLPPSGVQRGSVFQGIGDPLTPGWASTPGAEQIVLKDANLPRIPSLPISGRDAERILRGLGGPRAPLEWRGGLHPDCYTIGRGPARLNLTYMARQGVFPIRNVIGVIEGSEEPDRYVVLGNHRDAWVFGAVDPNSGTASMLEVARGLGALLHRGWKPRRSIILASWDAEEYGMVGSTEWVEENMGMLGARAVAYINVDCAVAGPGFGAAATPQLDDLIRQVTKEVKDPEGQYTTVFDAWQAAFPSGTPPISRLGDGSSDFAAFLQHAGIPALDLQFGDIYPVYHSEYDNYHWMVKFGDPLFHRHAAMTTIWGLLALRLADAAVLPFDYLTYAKELQNYAHQIQVELENVRAPADVVMTPLNSAINGLSKAASYIQQESKVFQSFRPDATDIFYFLLRRRAINDRLMLAERGFLDSAGLSGPGRDWYKHLVYGPAGDNNYGSTNFPGILDRLATACKYGNGINWDALQHEIWRVARAINGVSTILRGSLS